MFIDVALEDLAEVSAAFGATIAVTSRSGLVTTVPVAATPQQGRFLVRDPGVATLRDLGDNAAMTLIWAPRHDPGFTLIVDGAGELSDPDSPTSDVVVRPATAHLNPPVVRRDEEAGYPFWMSAFLDVDATNWGPALDFWTAATGLTLSPLRGDHDEFATLLPEQGDAHLRVQRVGAREGGAPTRIHLDLHVPDPVRAAERAVHLGAEIVHASEHGYVALVSPGGLPFCFVSHPAYLRAAATPWSEHRSKVEQVVLDCPPHLGDAEVRFWSRITGWAVRPSSMPGFLSLARPLGHPLRMLFQNLKDTQSDAVSAHLEFSSTDLGAETGRHLHLGARIVAEREWWTVMRAPTGELYCLVESGLETGLS